MAYLGVILDVDGTLVISNDAHAQAWVEAFALFGYDVKFEQVRPIDSQLKDAIAIYNDPADLLMHLDSSPIATKAMSI